MKIKTYFEPLWSELILINPETKKEWKIEIESNIIKTTLGKGKTKIKEVDEKEFFPPFHEAREMVIKQLRKGFIYLNKGAKSGEAIFHGFTTRNYSGFIPITTREDRDDFYTVRTVGQFEDEILYHYDGDGSIISKKSLGATSITFEMMWKDENTIYLERDFKKPNPSDRLYEYKIKEDEVLRKKSEDNLEIVEELKKLFKRYHTAGKSAEVIMKNLYGKQRIEKGYCIIEIYENDKETVKLEIINEFVGRKAAYSFTKNNLVLHSDFGVVSIYKL